MPADDNLALSTSGLHHLPPDESAPREPATARVDHRAPLVRLGDRIAELSARIQAATYELLVLIREFDAREGWDGCLSCAQWLSWRAGLAPGAAREHVRVARALGKLPKLSDAMRRGRISYSKVRAVTRVATPENEDDLLYVCQAGTAAHVERIARAWRRIDRNAEQAEEQRRNASRELRTWVDEDGMVVVRGRLTPEVGAVLRRALEAACDQARRAAAAGGGEKGEAAESPAGAEGDAADASADAAGEGEAADASADAGAEREAAGAPADAPEPTLAQRQADALGTVAEAALAGGLDRGTAGDRYQVVLHVDAEALAEPRNVPARTPGDAASGSMPRTRGHCVPAGTSVGTASESKPQANGYRVPAGTSAGAAPGSEPRTGGDRVPAETSVGAASESKPQANGYRVPTGTSAGAAPGSEPRTGGDRVPAGTPATARKAAGGPGAESPMRAGMPGRAGRVPRRRRRTSLPCPETRPTPAPGRQTVLDEAGGIHVSAETARRLACDAATVTMRHGPAGEILDVGRRTRTISPALRRALAARDRQCRFPGCGNRRVDAHHIEHWAHGGRTALDNLVLLCRRHHRAVHEEGYRVTIDAAGRVKFLRPDDHPLPEAPPAPAWTGPPLQPVNDGLAAAGIEIDADTGTPSWGGRAARPRLGDARAVAAAPRAPRAMSGAGFLASPACARGAPPARGTRQPSRAGPRRRLTRPQNSPPT